jgi:hypothetical protein
MNFKVRFATLPVDDRGPFAERRNTPGAARDIYEVRTRNIEFNVLACDLFEGCAIHIAYCLNEPAEYRIWRFQSFCHAYPLQINQQWYASGRPANTEMTKKGKRVSRRLLSFLFS